MSAQQPTIVAHSSGMEQSPRARFTALTRYALELADPRGTPRICFVGTASGDDAHYTRTFYSACSAAGWHGSHLELFPMPNLADPLEHLLGCDLVFVGGGSVAGLLRIWRLHGLDDVLHTAWRAGVVLSGVSAGSICWHLGGPTDSFGPTLRPVSEGLGFLPYGNGVHYDGEGQRRPLLHAMVADRTFDAAYATDDGAGVVYRDTEPVEFLTDQPGKHCYRIERGVSGQVTERVLDTRFLR